MSAACRWLLRQLCDTLISVNGRSCYEKTIVLLLCFLLAVSARTVNVSSEKIKIDEASFPNEVFLAYVKANIDNDKDGYLSNKSDMLIQTVTVR